MQVALSSLLYAAQDAAIEVLEGDVEHWIEYYKKERGTGSPPAVTGEPQVHQSGIATEDGSSSIDRAETGTPNDTVPGSADGDDY